MICHGCDGCLELRPAALDSDTPEACDVCRHWGGEPGSGALGSCRVSGSFRAPGGLFTEGGFWCCHWTKS